MDPGPTRWRGMVLQAFVVAFMDLSKEEAQAGSLSKATFKARVAAGMAAAKEAVECLKFDPKNN